LVAIAGGLARSSAPRLLKVLGAPDSAGRIVPPLAGMDRLNPSQQFFQWPLLTGVIECVLADRRQARKLSARPHFGLARG
jgi:hypothetical protein